MLKKGLIIVSVFIIVGIGIVFYLISNNDKITFSATEIDNCSNKMNYYSTFEDKEAYLVCLDGVFVKRGNAQTSLSEEIKSNTLTFNEFLKYASKKRALWDGGTTIHYYSNFVVILCQRNLSQEDPRGNILFSKDDSVIEQGLCD